MLVAILTSQGNIASKLAGHAMRAIA